MYKIITEDDDTVIICAKDNDCDFVNGFIDIYIDGGHINSPFENVDDAYLFAEIIVKILNVMCGEE